MAENKTLFTTPPPTINVPGRQYPVTIHFSRRTKPNYVAEAIRKTKKIHDRLPPGGILIFLTGQNEITGVCRKLETRFSPKVLLEKRKHSAISKGQKTLGYIKSASPAVFSAVQGDLEAEDIDFGVRREELATDVDDGVMDTDHIEEEEALDSDSENEEEDEMDDNWDNIGGEYLKFLPLPPFPRFIPTYSCSTDAHSSPVLSAPRRKTN